MRPELVQGRQIPSDLTNPPLTLGNSQEAGLFQNTVDCAALVTVEKQVQEYLNKAQNNLTYRHDPLFEPPVIRVDWARGHLDLALEVLGDQGTYDDHIEAVQTSLPQLNPLVAQLPDDGQGLYFRKEIADLQTVRDELEAGLLECVEGVPLDERVDRLAQAQRDAQTSDLIGRIFMIGAVVLALAPHMLRGLYRSSPKPTE